MPRHIKISYPSNVSFLQNPGFQLKKCNKCNSFNDILNLHATSKLG